VFLCVGYSTLAQYAGPNINVVSGTSFPGDAPFLQRQNERSFAVSSRNSLTLPGGANDYRTVDVRGVPDGAETHRSLASERREEKRRQG
jgi:hypothetical protein